MDCLKLFYITKQKCVFYIFRQKYIYKCFKSVLYSYKMRAPNNCARALKSINQKILMVWASKIYIVGKNLKVNMQHDCE